MRLHRLEVTAFGPYADTQVVDFDALNDAGVFLLTGPTGAGKTSILDAVCYALYAVVPGDREVRGLRSDHAPADRAPRVQLELTLGGRRLRVVRSPEWRRPKRRGDGTTREQASARLFEIGPDGTEHLRSDRAQEVGHELGLLLGMSSEQFMQVVLLPQSGFQTFLKARSDERRGVLEKLFSTQRFSRIEEWMHDRARSVRAQAQESLAELRTVVAVLQDRSGTPAPVDLHDPLRPEDAPALLAWADAVVTAAADRVGELATSVAAAEARAEEHEARLATVQALHLLAGRRDRARAELDQLDHDAATAGRRAAALEADRLAQRVAGLLGPLDRAAAREAGAEVETDAAEALARRSVDTVDGSADVPAPRLLEELADEEAALRALRPRVLDLQRLDATFHETAGALAGAEAALAGIDDEHADVPGRRAALEQDLAAAREAAARLEAALARHDTAVERRDAARLHARLVPRLAAAEDDQRRLHTAANDARSRALDLVARRLEGMAAELAASLVTGESCVVCGSTDHPAPAAPAGELVTETDQSAAHATAETARTTHEQARVAADRLRAEVAQTRQRCGGLGVDEAEQAVAGADAAVEAARRADTERRHLLERLTTLEDLAARLVSAHRAATTQVAELAARLEATASARAEAVSVLSAALRPGAGDATDATDAADAAEQADQPAADRLAAGLEDRLAAVTRAHRLVRALVGAQDAARVARAAHHEARSAAQEAAASAGFDDVDAARAALLEPATREEWQRDLQERQEARARLEGLLAEPELAVLDGPGTLPHAGHDLAAADELARTSRHEHARAVAAHEQAGHHLTALRAQADQLGRAVATWTPAETEAVTVGRLAGLVRGTGDNRLRMRLSSYVLATRLDQVLDAANGRLGHMRDTRYLLRRTDRGRRANAQSGLDLEVLDEWTGEVRPPSSLSGGECFVVSLALALGLADVIGEESGGVEVDTLFIDEGFGTLDAETLDQVMDRIDDLRSGGRAVGVVSHVGELRSRITTQVHVEPGRTGSRIAIAHGDA